MARSSQWLISSLIFAASLAIPVPSYAGLFTISTGGTSIFALNFNVNLNVNGSTTDPKGNVSPFSVNYNENIRHFSFVENSNANFDFDATNTYDVSIQSLWSVDSIFKFTDTGNIFGSGDVGDLLEGSLTAQHLVAPDAGDDPKGDAWSAPIAQQNASNLFNNGGARQVTVQLNDPVGNTKKTSANTTYGCVH